MCASSVKPISHAEAAKLVKDYESKAARFLERNGLDESLEVEKQRSVVHNKAKKPLNFTQKVGCMIQHICLKICDLGERLERS